MLIWRKTILLFNLITSTAMIKVFETKGENGKVNKEFAKVGFLTSKFYWKSIFQKIFNIELFVKSSVIV